MKVIRYELNEKRAYGVLDLEENIIRTNEALIAASTFEEAMMSFKKLAIEINVDEVVLIEPVQPTKNVICIGKNYHDHILEFDGTDELIEEVKENPIFFTKTVSSLCGPDAIIDGHPKVTAELDYEGELGVVIGKTCKDVSPDEAFDYVFGYTIVNDVTARDLQRKHKQWFLGKGLDTFCPVGPYVVTADEVGDPQRLAITTKVNGEVRQDANTDLMIHKIANQIAFVSQGMTLNPGDVIATGTPKGVGMGFNPKRFLQDGDVVEIEIENIGVLKNTVKR